MEQRLRPTRQPHPHGGRPYIGPKAQSSVHQDLWDRTFAEAEARGVPHTDVWREVIYAGLLATRRATRAEIESACELVGIDHTGAIGAVLGGHLPGASA